MRFEVALTACPEGVDVYDIHTGTLLRSINSQNNQGSMAVLEDDYVVLTQKDKPVVHIYCWKTGASQLRCSVPEQITSLAVSHDQQYFVAGGCSGKVYIWSMATGTLLNCFQAHYKKVSTICFTSDDSFLLTGGDDSTVNAWLFDSHLLIPATSYSKPVSPWVEWAEHTLPVTALFAGTGLAGRVVSCSLDRTCKMYDIPSKSMLFSFVFPSFVTSVVLDPAESNVFCGAGDGNIYKRSLLGDHDQQENSVLVFKGHKLSITSLDISFNGSLLLSASEDGTSCIWDTSTGQLLRTMTKNRATYQNALIVQDTNSFLGVQSTFTRGSSNKVKELFPMLKKHVNGMSAEDSSYPFKLKGSRQNKRKYEKPIGSGKSNIDDAWPIFFSGEVGRVDLEKRVAEEVAANQQAQLELERWKKVSRSLYTFCADQIVEDCKLAGEDAEDDDENGEQEG